MASPRADRLDRRVDPARDHVLGPASAELTLVEYGSYACPHCHAAHQVVANLQDRFGDRLRYAYRHLPLTDRALATRAAELVEYGASDDDAFWAMHDSVMSRSAEFDEGDLARIADEFGVPPAAQRDRERDRAAGDRVREDAQSGIRSGARATPTFFINGRRYEGAWDEAALTEALLGSLGHRLRVASLDFARWGPSTGFLLVVMSLVAILLTNSALGPGFAALWHEPFGLRFGNGLFTMPLLDWVNDGLLTVFFLVVGLEIKRELTIGRLASPRAAALPIAGALGGMTVPALLYLALVAPAAYAHGWGTTIATDTAFAVALIVLLGNRVPVDLRVFLTAAVIVDDLVAIGVVALFYSEALVVGYLLGALAVTALMVGLNRSGVYRPLPYVVLGLGLWACLHAGGVHATLAGVILALVIPTRPPANLAALLAQAQSVLQAENVAARGAHAGGRLSHDALSALDVIHDRIDSPASKVLRAVEPWSSYVVLPVFALANAGVVWSPEVMRGRGALAAAIVVGLVVGKPLGILGGSWLAVRAGLARKPGTYTWRQLTGAGALGGIGFTMSLFIAGQAFPAADDFSAAKIAVFLASLLAAIAGAALLWKPPHPDSCRLPTSPLPEG